MIINYDSYVKTSMSFIRNMGDCMNKSEYSLFLYYLSVALEKELDASHGIKDGDE